MICSGHDIEGGELVTAFRVNKCRLQGVVNSCMVGSQDEASSQMDSQPAGDSCYHLNATIDTRIRVCFLYICTFLLH